MNDKLLLIPIFILLLTNPSSAQEHDWGVEECMRYAVENSPSGRRQELTIADAENTRLEAKLNFLPSVNASTGASVNFGRSINPATNVYDNVSNLGNSYSIGGSMDLFNGFNNITLLKISKFSRLRAEADSKRIDDMIALETMKAFYQVLFDAGKLKIAKEKLTESKTTLKKTEIEDSLGLRNLYELTQIRNQLSKDELDSISCEGNLEKSLLQLKKQMYYPINKSMRIDTMAAYVPEGTASQPDPQDIIHKALSFLPEIEMAEYDIKTSKQELNRAKGSLFPRLSASGGYSTGYSKELPSNGSTMSYREQLKNRSGEYVSVQLSIPLFNSLSSQLKIRNSRNEYKRKVIDYQEKISDIEQIIHEVVLDLTLAEKEYHQAVRIVESSTLSYRMILRKYEEGLSSILDVQTVRKELTEARVMMLNSALDYRVKLKIVRYFNGEPYFN